ncbi:hypothetical protein PAMA_016794 [Pampus argenteus]
MLGGAFTALLLLITALFAEIIPPPTNVTLRCQNLQTTVHWEYGPREPQEPREPQGPQGPQTIFRVTIGGSAGNFEDETADHQYDLSPFIWESEERYMGFHYVSVSAVRGGVRSQPATSRTLSYNSLKTAHITCELLFPPADLTVEDSELTVSFQNPLHYYKKLRWASRWAAPTFTFNVDTGFTGNCIKEQDVCRQAIVFPDGAEKKCVTLRGKLFEQNGVGQVLFRETDDICVKESSDVHVMTLIILLAIFVLVIAVITLIIYKVKAWTMKTSDLPKCLVRPLCHPVTQEDSQLQTRTAAAGYNAAELIKHSPNKNPSVCPEEGTDAYGSLRDENSVDSDLQPIDCMYMEGGLLQSSSEDLEAAGHMTDDDSGTVECHLISEEEERSPYDCPHTHMDMGDGDMVLAYNR